MSSKSEKRPEKEERKHKDKKREEKSKSKRSKKHSSREQRADSEFSKTAYTALPVHSSWKSSSKSTSSSKLDGAPLISSARKAGEASGTEKSASSTSSSLDAADSSLYSAQPQTKQAAPVSPASGSTNLLRADSRGRTPSMMYGAFAQEEVNLGVSTEPATPSKEQRSNNLIPSSVSLPHLMGRKMVSPPSPQTYAAMPIQSSSSNTNAYSSVPELEQAACVESGACMPGLRLESESTPESLGQKTAREYASNTAYAHFFKTDDEIQQEKAKNASNRTPRDAPARTTPPASDMRATYESMVYYSQENVGSTPSKDESDSDDDDSKNQLGIGYSLPEDLAGKQRVEGLLMRLDKRLRKLESRERRKKVDSDDEDSDDDDRIHNLSTDDHLYSMRFQQILEDNKISKFVSLASLGNDFVSLAETYARIIVSERCLPLEQKSLKPVSIGGAAGGEKFLVRGILFKYAVDTIISHSEDGQPRWMYGGRQRNDFFAMKAAANELLGLSHMMQYQVESLSFPLMALIDYCGYRLVAVSTLPINKSTIVYGSHDAGRTVHNDDPVVAKAMHELGGHLNLREHLVCDTRIVGAGDIEVHKGLDGRNYVLDFARTFPPEAPAPGENPQSIFYRLLRPELVRRFPKPLSSDAFSGWQLYDPNNSEMNHDVVEATEFLHSEVIAKYHDGWMSQEFQEFFKSEFCNICDLHRKGINIRHLGRLRAAMLTKTKENDALYLGDMIVRSIKNRLRQTQRDLTDRMKIFAEEPHKMEFIKALNIITSPSTNTEFWKKEIKLLIADYFGEDALLPNEKDESYSLIESIPPAMRHFLVWRLCYLQGVNLPQHLISDARKCFAANTEFEFFLEDISDSSVFRPRIKYMALLDFSTAVAGYLRALSQFDSPQRAMSTQRLLNEAKMRMLLATDRITNMAPGLLWMSKIYFALSNFTTSDYATNVGRAVFLLKLYRERNPADVDAAVFAAAAAAVLLVVKQHENESTYVQLFSDAMKSVPAERVQEVADEVLLWVRRSHRLRGEPWQKHEIETFASRTRAVLSSAVTPAFSTSLSDNIISAF